MSNDKYKKLIFFYNPNGSSHHLQSCRPLLHNPPIDMNKIKTDFAMELLRVKKRFVENGRNDCSSS